MTTLATPVALPTIAPPRNWKTPIVVTVLAAVTFLAFAALFQVVDGAQAVASGMLRGMHDTAVPMLFAAIGYWGVGMPLGVVLAFWAGMEGVGIWIGLSGGLAVVAVLLVLRWMARDRFIRPLRASYSRLG